MLTPASIALIWWLGLPSQAPDRFTCAQDAYRLCDQTILTLVTQPPDYDSRSVQSRKLGSQTVTSWSCEVTIGGSPLGLGLPLSTIRSNTVRSRSIKSLDPHGAAKVDSFFKFLRLHSMTQAAVSAWALRRKLLWLVVKRHTAQIRRVVERT
jgi:hypothetical protein